MEQMLITQALDERELLIKKIGDKIEKAGFIDFAKHNEDKAVLSKLTKEEFAREASAQYQQIQDLITRYQKIDAAIVASNAETYIETSQGRFTVAAAIAMKARLCEDDAYRSREAFELKLMKQMQDAYDKAVSRMDSRNRDLDSKAEEMRLTILGKDVKVKSDKPLDVVESYVAENKTELVDPLGLKAKLDELTAKISDLRTELNTKIKVSNATTMIEI